MKSPKILLIGIGGVYNYGCEAIVRGTEIIVRSEYPDANIVYASNRVTEDRKMLEGSQVQVIERGRFRRYSLKNICRKLLTLAGIKWCPMVDSMGLVEGVDAVFSIGGDIYTLAPDGGYSMSFPKFGDAVRKLGIPYALWGASVGPFTTNHKAEKAYTKHLKGLSLITAREVATVDYLRTLGISANVVSCADPAYVVAPEIKAKGTNREAPITIGINLSPLSAHFTKNTLEESISRQAQSIQGLIHVTKARVMLIPHVVANFDEGNDDLRYLQKVKQAMAPAYQTAVSILENDLGFTGTKKELVKCDLVIAARMHCAINALAARIPTILVAYSRKAVGMAKYVYGNQDWVISLDQLVNEKVLEAKVQAMNARREEIHAYLNDRIPIIQKEVYRPIERLKAVLGAR